MGPVLIATDGSEEALDAARAAVDLLRPDVELVVVACVEGPDLMDVQGGGFEGPAGSPEELEREEAEAVVEGQAEVAATARALGDRPVTHRVLEGAPGPSLVLLAGELGASAIVVGSHERGLWSRVVHGSVSHHLIDHAPCPVLVVRHEET